MSANIICVMSHITTTCVVLCYNEWYQVHKNTRKVTFHYLELNWNSNQTGTRASNIAKNLTSNRKQFTVICEMLTAIARDQSEQLKVT